MVQKMKAIIITMLILVSLAGCDPVITFPIDDSSKKKLNFTCGTLSVKAVKSLGPGYIINQEFQLTKEISIFFDSLNIKHKGSPVMFDIFDAQKKSIITEREISVNGKEIINLKISDNFESGDTLLLQMKGYIICEGASVYDNEIVVILK
jgi:hypothetical protein